MTTNTADVLEWALSPVIAQFGWDGHKHTVYYSAWRFGKRVQSKASGGTLAEAQFKAARVLMPAVMNLDSLCKMNGLTWRIRTIKFHKFEEVFYGRVDALRVYEGAKIISSVRLNHKQVEQAATTALGVILPNMRALDAKTNELELKWIIQHHNLIVLDKADKVRFATPFEPSKAGIESAAQLILGAINVVGMITPQRLEKAA